MAYITIEADTDGGARTLHESLSCEDLDSQLFADHLVERVRWAVEDTVAPPEEPETAAPATLASGVLDALDPRRT
jgi:hypothetical protein